MAPNKPAELRILLRTVTGKDASIASALLERAGIVSQTCRSAADLAREIRVAAGALLIAEETLSEPGMVEVADLLQEQPPWSDLPVLVIASPGAVSNAVMEVMDTPANVTVIERPLRMFALISAVRSALRGRARQYELRRLLRDLREADQRKTEFIATLAHELRNPLAPLSTSLSILTMKPHRAEAAKPHYEMMRRQVNHMVRLIDDLLEVSRITRGKIELKMENVRLARVLAEAVELSRPALQSGRHEFSYTPPPDEYCVRGDALRLTQVFANLLNNAAKYTPRGGLIQLKTERAGERVWVRVRDNGVGIPPEMLGAVFDMFVQVGNTARTGQGGLGIGLTLVKSLVERHGGSVRASSAGAGQGSEFAVDLPLVAAIVQAAVERTASPLPAAIEENILIVDDNRDAADSLALLLGSCGAQTVVAYDGQGALERLSRVAPTVAILDIGMPGMDGYELARRVRTNAGTRKVLLIALTGWGQWEDRTRIAAAGFDHHFLKPIDAGALIDTIRARGNATA